MFGNWNFNFAIVLYNTRGGHVRGTHITCYHALSIVSKRLVYIGDPRKNITLCLLPDGGQMLSREQGEGGGILVHPISRFWQFPSSEKLRAKFTEINRFIWDARIHRLCRCLCEYFPFDVWNRDKVFTWFVNCEIVEWKYLSNMFKKINSLIYLDFWRTFLRD